MRMVYMVIMVHARSEERAVVTTRRTIRLSDFSVLCCSCLGAKGTASLTELDRNVVRSAYRAAERGQRKQVSHGGSMVLYYRGL